MHKHSDTSDSTNGVVSAQTRLVHIVQHGLSPVPLVPRASVRRLFWFTCTSFLHGAVFFSGGLGLGFGASGGVLSAGVFAAAGTGAF